MFDIAYYYKTFIHSEVK